MTHESGGSEIVPLCKDRDVHDFHLIGSRLVVVHQPSPGSTEKRAISVCRKCGDELETVVEQVLLPSAFSQGA